METYIATFFSHFGAVRFGRQLREAGLSCKVVVGGAVITQDYADSIGADRYAADAMESVHYAQEVLGDQG